MEEKMSMATSVARGGPIYVPNLVGPLTRIPDFESALLRELEDLKNELPFDSSSSSPNEDGDEDISVDDIKPFSDEDLVEMALKEEDTPPPLNVEECNGGDCLHPSPEPSNARENDLRVPSNEIVHLESSGRGIDPPPALESLDQGNGCAETITHNKSRKRKISSNKHTITNVARKRKARKENKLAINERCLARVNELLKIKEKQHQEIATSRLYSLNCKINKRAVPSSEKNESVNYLKSTYFEKQQLKPPNVQEHIALQHPEFVLCIEVYHNTRNWIKTQEFLVLGRQMLTEMRDKIYCMTDQVVEKAGQHDPSGYFLIEDVFCNDMRDPLAIDYSEPIFDWLRNSKDDALRKWECITSGELHRKQKAVLGEFPTSHLPQFRRVEMQKTRFCDLRFRLGAGYLYCHQGDCKHIVVVRDMRLIHPEDVQNQAAYPVVIFQLKSRVQKCSVCGIFRATKVTVDDKWTPYKPCYFCNDCYYLLHYENNSLLYSDFSTYDYLQDLPD